MFFNIFTPKVVLILSTIGVVSILIFFAIAIAIFVIRRNREGISIGEAIERIGVSIWLVIFDVISLPWKIFKGLFFVTNGDLSKGRVKFSLTRTVFGVGSFIMLFRLMSGGVVVEDVRFGPDVKSKSERHIKKLLIKSKRLPTRITIITLQNHLEEQEEPKDIKIMDLGQSKSLKP